MPPTNGQTLIADRGRLAEPGAQIDDPLLQTILMDYLAARRSPMPHNVGEHWNVFRGDFDQLIRTPEIWPRFRRMAISYGFDDSLKYSEGRNRLDLLIFRSQSTTTTFHRFFLLPRLNVRYPGAGRSGFWKSAVAMARWPRNCAGSMLDRV